MKQKSILQVHFSPFKNSSFLFKNLAFVVKNLMNEYIKLGFCIRKLDYEFQNLLTSIETNVFGLQWIILNLLQNKQV